MSIPLYGDIGQVLPGNVMSLHSEVESRIAGEALSFGAPLFGAVGDGTMAYSAKLNAVQLTFDDDLVEGNIIAVTVNTIEIPNVLFEVDIDTTLAKLADTINLNEDVDALGITAFSVPGDVRHIFFQGPGVTITVTCVVTGGASQPTAAS